MPKRAHDGAESETKIARRTGPLETLPVELIELFAAYAGAQACAALAQTCRWMNAFLHEPARSKRLLDAHTTKKCISCLVTYCSTESRARALITRRLLPSGRRHGPEEIRLQDGDRLLRQYHSNNGFLHGTMEAWQLEHPTHWVCEWHKNKPVRAELINDTDGTRRELPITYDKYGCSSLPFELWASEMVDMSAK